jgi:hypothetical protein
VHSVDHRRDHSTYSCSRNDFFFSHQPQQEDTGVGGGGGSADGGGDNDAPATQSVDAANAAHSATSTSQRSSTSQLGGSSTRSQGLQDKLARLSAMRRTRMSRNAAASGPAGEGVGAANSSPSTSRREPTEAALTAAQDEIKRLKKALARAREERDLADARALSHEPAEAVADKPPAEESTAPSVAAAGSTTTEPMAPVVAVVASDAEGSTAEERYVSNFAIVEDSNEDDGEQGYEHGAGRRKGSDEGVSPGPFDGLLHDEALATYLLSLYESGADLTQITETQRVQEETISE